MLRVITVLFLSAYCLGGILAESEPRDDPNSLVDVTKPTLKSTVKEEISSPEPSMSNENELAANGKATSTTPATAHSGSGSLSPEVKKISPVTSPDSSTDVSTASAVEANNEGLSASSSTGHNLQRESVGATLSSNTDDSVGLQNGAGLNGKGMKDKEEELRTTGNTIPTSPGRADSETDLTHTVNKLLPTSGMIPSGSSDPISTNSDGTLIPTTSHSDQNNARNLQNDQNTAREQTGTSSASAAQPSANNDKMATGAPAADNGGLAKGSYSLGSIINLAFVVLFIGFASRYI